MVDLTLDSEKCMHCGICVNACPLEIFEIKKGKVNLRKHKTGECIECNLCIDTCPEKAIKMK